MKLLFVGDVMLGRLVNQVLKSESPEFPWGNTLPIFQKADLRFCNLECVISDLGEPWSMTPKVFHFRTDTKNVNALKAASIDPVALANNHVLDYGYEALDEMLKILAENAINYAGTGRNDSEAAMPAVCNLQGKRVGLIAFTDNEPAWEATVNKPGIFYVPINLQDHRANRLIDEIKKARNLTDFLVVSAHWGPNWGYEPPREHISFAHALVDAGADLIFGHSGHVFRGIEMYKNKPILYCAGDFIDDYAVDEIERNDQSFIYIFDTESKRMVLYPTIITNFQAQLAEEEKEEIANKMITLCKNIVTHVKWVPENEFLEILLS